MRWYLFAAVMISLVAVMTMFDIHHLFIDNDQTFISTGIFGVFVLSSLVLGLKTYRVAFNDVWSDSKYLWYIPEFMVTAGLVGTIIGFIIATSGTFGLLDVSDTSSVKEALVSVAAGLGTALYTTLMGYVCGVLVSLQIMNMEMAIGAYGETSDEYFG